MSFFDGACYFHTKNRAEPLRVPAVAAFQKGTDRVLTVGEDAARMVGKTPDNIVVRHGLGGGLPIDPHVTDAVIRHGFRVLIPNRFFKPRPRVVLALRCVSHRTRDAKETMLYSGAREVYLMETGMAAGLGMGLPVQEAAHHSVLTVSNDWFDFSVISLSGIVAKVDGDVGLDDFARDIRAHVRLTQGFLPDSTCILRALLFTGLQATEGHGAEGWEAWLGRSGLGARTSGTLEGETLATGLMPSLLRIIEAIRGVLENLPRERTAAWQSAPIHCCGAAFQCPGMAELFSQHLGLRCEKSRIQAPTILGATRALDEMDFLRKVTSSSSYIASKQRG